MVDSFNPYASPEPREPAAAVVRKFPRALSLFTLLACALQILVTVLGTIGAFVEIESIVAAGPTATLLGLMVTGGSARRHVVSGVAFGLSAVLITVLCFVVINVLNWGPSDAQTPISYAILIYAAATLPIGVLAFAQLLKA